MSLLSELRRRNVLRMAVLYMVAAWLIMQVVEVLMSLVGLPLWTGQVTLVVLAIGFPIALAFSWFYELTPEGVQLDSDIDATVSGVQVSGRRMDFVVISLLIAALLVFAYDKWWLRDDAAINLSAPNSVAVLPFKNMSGNPDNEYFSDGLTETLLHALAQLPDLKVPARTSSFFFKGRDIDVREIAGQLGVSKILEGSVQRSGHKLRVVAQLIEADTGFHLWSNTYDRDMNDVFAVQDDIATSVALAMQMTLAGGGKIETVSTDNVAAFEKYLQGLQQKNRNSFESLLLAETLLKSALATDPGFFDARLELAHTYRDQQQAGVITFEVAGERIEPLLEQLLIDKPDDGLVLMIAGYIDFIRSVIQGKGEFDVEAQIARLEPAIGRTPNEARLYVDMSHHLRAANRRDEATKWLERGIEVDPLDWGLHMELGRRLMSADDLGGAQTSFMKAVELNPEAPVAYIWASEVFRHRKEHAKSFAMFNKAIELGPLDHQARALMALRLYTIGLMEEGDRYWQHASAIDPGDGFVQLTKLYRLLLLDDHTEARAMSEALLREDTDSSRGHSFNVVVFLSTMTEAEQVEVALDVLEELWPGVTSSDFEPVGEHEVMLYGHVLLFMARSLGTVEALDALNQFTARWEKSSHFFAGPRVRASIALADGDRELAVELALKSLEQGLELADAIPYQIFRYSDHLLALAQEPAIAARLADLDAEAKQAGKEVWATLQAHKTQL